MFDLDIEVRRWRERQESESSLSPRELDELEDHLRARVDLELELNAVLAPAQAFAITRRGLGGTGRVASAGPGHRLLGLDGVLLLRRRGPVDARQGVEAGHAGADRWLPSVI